MNENFYHKKLFIMRTKNETHKNGSLQPVEMSELFEPWLNILTDRVFSL
jgi:hypothetical protein